MCGDIGYWGWLDGWQDGWIWIWCWVLGWLLGWVNKQQSIHVCGGVVDQVGLMVSRNFHCEFASFLKLVVGCAKMGPRIYPILLNWIHPVPGFYCVLVFPCPGNNHVGNVGRLFMCVRVSFQFTVFWKIFNLVEDRYPFLTSLCCNKTAYFYSV